MFHLENVLAPVPATENNACVRPSARILKTNLRDFITSLYEVQNEFPSRLTVQHTRRVVTTSRTMVGADAKAENYDKARGIDRPSTVCGMVEPNNQTERTHGGSSMDTDCTEVTSKPTTGHLHVVTRVWCADTAHLQVNC